jgi:hypothetical protein
MSVIQHKSVIGTTQNVSLTLNSPVTADNLLVAVIGHGSGSPVIYLEDFSQPSSLGWNGPLSASGISPLVVEAWNSLAQSSETYTLQVNFGANDGSAKHIHLFEVSGYDTFDKQGASSNGATNAPTVGIGVNTTKAIEFVLAAFLDATHSVEPFTPGIGYTAGETTNASGFSMFTEWKEITAVGQPQATASIPNVDSVYAFMVTFYSSTGGGGGSTSTFLGSVRVLGSAPAGAAVPFIGTVKVIGSAPSGVPNPYLGSVVQGNPVAGGSNPTIGEVVIVASVPSGDSDEFLGAIVEGS